MKFIFTFFLSTAMLVIISAQKGNEDRINPYHICTFGTYDFDGLKAYGAVAEDLQLRNSNQLDFIIERNSMWLEWRVQKAGNLTFEISPTVIDDDFDFILYKVVDLKSNQLEPIRIMLSGKNLSQSERNINCLGRTGLRASAQDIEEKDGCLTSDDNFLAPIIGNKGEHYMLLVNSFSPSSSFRFNISGSGELNQKPCKSLATRTHEELKINVYPNPVGDYLTVNYILDPDFPAEILILDVSGKLLKKEHINLESEAGSHNLETTNLIPGQYFIKITNGSFAFDHKFLKI